MAVELAREWIKEPYQLNGPDPLIFELFKQPTVEELTKKCSALVIWVINP